MSERQIAILLDSLLPLLKAGVAFTVPLTLVSFVLGLLLAVLTALARLSAWRIQKGQWEAAASLGMTRWQALRRIIIPQAARVSVPPLSNSFISLVKDTSLASSITYLEMFRVSTQIATRTYEPLLVYCEVGVIYLLFCTVLSWLQGWLEKRLARYSAS
jgi:cystine transport system permease protein